MKKLFLSLIAATLCISQVSAQCEIPVQSVSASFSTGWPPCWYSSGVSLTFETIIFNTGGGGNRWVVLPMTVDGKGILEFDALNSTNSQAGPGNFQFGVASVTGAGAMATFEMVEALDIYATISGQSIIWSHHVIDFSAYAGTGQYIVIWMSGAVSREVRLDNVVYTSDCLISGPCIVPEPPKTFVDQDATGANNGTSWADAYTSLQTALTAGGTNDIWVAEGIYTPHASDRDASFIIPNTVKLYGGFAGTETLLSERDIAANPTILSGDLLGNDNANIMHTEATRQDNSYHVVKIRGQALNIVVDGFTISGGNANGSTAATCATAAASQYYRVRGGAIFANPYVASNVISASFNNCILEKNTALNVAVYASFVPCGVATTTTDVDFNHCIIRNNYSHELAAMMYNGSSGYSNFSYGSLNNSLMYDNVSGGNASCLYLGSSNVNGGTTAGLSFDMINSTIADNTGVSGNAINMVRAANSRIRNSIIYGNGSTTPFAVTTSGSVVTNSIVQGGQLSGTNVDPLYRDAANDDYSLNCGSPALEMGSLTGITPPATDLAGNPRQFQTIDMGAYEYQAAPYTASVNDNEICQGESVTFSTSGATNVSWDNGVISDAPFFPSGTATYTVTAADTEGCVSTRSIAVTVLPAPSINISSSGSAVCEGASVTLTASGANSLSWDNGISNGVSFIPVADQTYTVTGTGANGCAGSAQESVTVGDAIAPVADVGALPTITQYCEVTNVATPTATDNCAGTLNGSAAFNLPITSSTTITWTYDDGNGNTATQTQDIVIEDVSAAITQNGGTLTASQSGADYQWVDCDNANAPVANETSQDFTPSASGNYAVEVTINGCTETSACVNMIVTGINEANAPQLSIFPIPATSVLNIVSSEMIKELMVYSMEGKQVANHTQNTTTVDVSALASGMYLLVARTGSGLSQHRFIKE